MIDLSLMQILAYVGAGVAAYMGVKVFKKGDDRVERRRLAASQVAANLQERGLTGLSSALQKYSIGDYSGLAAQLVSMADTLLNPKAADAEFEGVFDKMLLAKLNEPDKRDALMIRIKAVTEGKS